MAVADSNQSPVHIDDVVSYFAACSNAFGQVAAILKAIEQAAPEYSEVKKLAGGAWWIANDHDNLAGCWSEEVQKNGIKTGA